MALYGVDPMLPEDELMQGMNQRRSGQAQQLQAAQAQMGGLGQAPPGGSAPPGGAPQPQQGGRLRAMMEQRQQQAQSLQSRQADLQTVERLMQVLDPRLPKSARQFLYRELSSSLGIDPKGQRSKELGQMLTSLEPEVSEGIRRQLVEQSRTAQPGQVQQMARGILTGEVPVTQLVNMMPRVQPGAEGAPAGGAEPTAAPAGAPAAAPAAPLGGGPLGGSPMMRLGGPGPGSRPGEAGSIAAPAQYVTDPPGTSIGPASVGPAALPPSAQPTGAPRYREGEVSPRMREIAPELQGALGLDISQRVRNIDVMSATHPLIPSDYEGQQRMATDIRGSRGGVVDTLVLSNHLANMIRGREDALTLTLPRLPFLGEITVGNPRSGLVQASDFLRGILGGGRPDDSAETINNWSNPDERRSGIIRQAVDNMVANARRAGAEIRDSAVLSARIQGALVPLAFAMAAAKGQSGRFLSDRDVELQLQEIGRSASPEQFEATIRDMARRIYDGYNTRMRAATGGDVPLDPVITDEAARVLRTGGITPDELLQSIGRGRGGPPPRPGRWSGPVQVDDDDDPAPAPGEPGAVEAGIARGPGAALARAAGVPARPPGATPLPEGGEGPVPTRAGRRIPLVAAPIEEEEAAARGRVEEDRAATLEARDFNRRRIDIAESSELRAARGEERAVERERRERIERAFMEIGRALRSSAASGASIGGGAGAGGGGDQDAAAFRITPAPQRRPPEPVQAHRFQRR